MPENVSEESRKMMLVGGAVLLGVAVLVLIGFGVYIVSKNNIFGPSQSSQAILFIDTPGRIVLDGTLQVDGPAPVPVAAGEHTITYFDRSETSPVAVTASEGEFVYIPNTTVRKAAATRAAVKVSAFPPDTAIKIPDCTPRDSSRAITCKAEHTLQADLSPGTYRIQYTHPHLGTFEEDITVEAGAVLHRDHSFLTTVDQWNEWRQTYGEVIERSYGRYGRNYGIGGAVLLPFEATGELVGELFD